MRLFALLLCAAAACQHAPLAYTPDARSGIFSIEALDGGRLMPPGWTGRQAPKPDEKVDYFFERDEDSAWIFANGYDVINDATATDDLFNQALANGALGPGMRFSGVRMNLRSGPGTTVLDAKTRRQLTVKDGEGMEAEISVSSPPMQLYVALVRRGRLAVVVMAGRSRGRGAVPAEAARDLARRLRLQ